MHCLFISTLYGKCSYRQSLGHKLWLIVFLLLFHHMFYSISGCRRVSKAKRSSFQNLISLLCTSNHLQYIFCSNHVVFFRCNSMSLSIVLPFPGEWVGRLGGWLVINTFRFSLWYLGIPWKHLHGLFYIFGPDETRGERIVFSVPNMNTNIIRVRKFDRIRIQILFVLFIMTEYEYEYYSERHFWSNTNTNT